MNSNEIKKKHDYIFRQFYYMLGGRCHLMVPVDLTSGQKNKSNYLCIGIGLKMWQKAGDRV